MEKLKVSKEVGNSLLELREQGIDEKEALRLHALSTEWSTEEFVPLNTLSQYEMAQAMLVGYEIKKDEKELLLESYKSLDLLNPFDGGYAHGIKAALRAVNVKIKGINE